MMRLTDKLCRQLIKENLEIMKEFTVRRVLDLLPFLDVEGLQSQRYEIVRNKNIKLFLYSRTKLNWWQNISNGLEYAVESLDRHFQEVRATVSAAEPSSEVEFSPSLLCSILMKETTPAEPSTHTENIRPGRSSTSTVHRVQNQSRW